MSEKSFVPESYQTDYHQQRWLFINENNNNSQDPTLLTYFALIDRPTTTSSKKMTCVKMAVIHILNCCCCCYGSHDFLYLLIKTTLTVVTSCCCFLGAFHGYSSLFWFNTFRHFTLLVHSLSSQGCIFSYLYLPAPNNRHRERMNLAESKS